MYIVEPAVKPDLDYIAKLLAAFEDAPGPHTDIDELREAGIESDDNYVFHLHLLADRGLVASLERNGGLGIIVGNTSTQLMKVPLRLTAAGHEFAAGLREPKVLKAIKDKAPDAGIAVWVQVAAATLSALFGAG